MKLLQIWKFSGPGRDADNLDEAISIAVQNGFDSLLVKALDGTHWMRDYDGSPDAIGSADQVASQRDRCHAAGLKYYVWTNPLHDVDLDLQAARTGDAALAADGLFLDVEPYAGPPPFWGPLRPIGLASGFMQKVRDRAPNAWIALQPDPRAARLAEVRPEEWLPFIDAFAGQHYWTDFSPQPGGWAARARLELANAAEIGRTYGKPVWPTLPGNADVASVPLDLLSSFPGFVVWRMGSTGQAMRELLGSVQLATTEVAAPPPAIDPFQSLIGALAYVCDTLGDQINQSAAKLDEAGTPIRDTVLEMQRVRAQFIGPRDQPAAEAPQQPTPEPQPSTPEIPSGPVFNPGTPTLTQPNSWACSVFSATMALQSIGQMQDWLTIRGEMGGAVTEASGLQDARGPALVQLFQNRGCEADAIPFNRDGGASWDEVQERAGRMPVLLGGINWNHWTFVRGLDENGNLRLGNPAPSWKFVGQTLDRSEFSNLGPWTMVWIKAGGEVEDDPVRVQQLESEVGDLQTQVQERQDAIGGLTNGLAHVVDVVVAELADPDTTTARRTELADAARTIREQFIGPAPAPVS